MRGGRPGAAGRRLTFDPAIRDLGPWTARLAGGFTRRVFVRAQLPIEAGFEAAAASLRAVAADGWLTGVSAEVYDSSLAGISGLTRVGPSEGARWMSKLVRVYARDVVVHDGQAVLTVRWEATGPGGGLFPALDADITLSPAGPGVCLLTLDGAYRPPFGTIGAGLDKIVLSRAAAPTARALLRRIADSIVRPAAPLASDQEEPLGEPAS